METCQLEFRGIPRSHLELYFVELGGEKITDTLPIVFQGDDWWGKIVAEKEVVITSSFKVNAIIVEFTARTKEGLEALIKKYRFKTMRVGG